MDIGLLAKWVHILSSTLLFGTGIGTAFFFVSAIRTRDPQFIAKTGKTVVLADYLFTLTSGIVQPVTGLFLVHYHGYSLGDAWLFWTLVLYVIALCCWLPVVWLQIKLTKMATEAAAAHQPLPQYFFKFFWWWFALGWPAFVGLVVVFWLMVAKPT